MVNDLLKKYSGKKVFITGHTGFKGGWLTAWLKLLGAEVMGYSCDVPTTPSFFSAVGLDQHVEHITGDVRDFENLKLTMKNFGPEFVFHLAAQSLVRASYREPKRTFDTNVIGTLNVLQAVRSVNSVKVCIVVTTDKCYENKEVSRGYQETDPLGGYDPYSASKACAEIVTASFRQSFFADESAAGLATVRAGNVIGGGDWGEDRLLPDCVRALQSQNPINIRNPESVRPWQYVLDPLSGYLILGILLHQNPQKYAQAWNFGPSEGMIKVEDIVKKVIQIWGSGEYQVAQAVQGGHETKLLLLDVSKASQYLLWHPRYKIGESLACAMEWYLKFYNHVAREQMWEFTLQQISDYQKILCRESVTNVEG